MIQALGNVVVELISVLFQSDFDDAFTVLNDCIQAYTEMVGRWRVSRHRNTSGRMRPVQQHRFLVTSIVPIIIKCKIVQCVLIVVVSTPSNHKPIQDIKKTLM